jgi:hypothetical protein
MWAKQARKIVVDKPEKMPDKALSTNGVRHMTVTANEAAVLRAIATNYYNELNGGSPSNYAECGNPVWKELINDASMKSGIEGKTLSGVCGSLATKGYTGSDDECIWIKEPGFDAMIEFYGSVEAAFAGND